MVSFGEKRARTESDDLNYQTAITSLADVQDHLDKLTEDAADAVLEIEQKYSKLKRPVYERRSQILKDMPDFWWKTMRHALGTNATDDDLDVLGYLVDVDVVDEEDIKSGYKIKMTFKHNPFFSNTELVKTFRYIEGGNLQILATRPLWMEGFEPSDDMPGQHISNQERGTGARYYNFFMWFDHDDDVVESTALDHTAELIKEEVWVNPVKYYELDSDEEGEPDGLQGDEEFDGFDAPDEGEDAIDEAGYEEGYEGEDGVEEEAGDE